MGLHDECGVAGIFNAENSAALTYFALTSLQHRGQESAGIAVSEELKFIFIKIWDLSTMFLSTTTLKH